MIRFSKSPACHKRATCLATSAQQFTLLTIVRKKALCQAPPPWRHNAIPRLRHIQNTASFWNLELDTLSDIKTTGKYWLNFVFWHHGIKINRVVSWYDPPDLTREPYHVTTQFHHYITSNPMCCNCYNTRQELHTLTYFMVTWFTCAQLYALWRHAMETLSALLTLCEGNPPVHRSTWIPLTKGQ